MTTVQYLQSSIPKYTTSLQKKNISAQTINEVSVENFKNILSSTDWNDVLGKTITNESYHQFMKNLASIMMTVFL